MKWSEMTMITTTS